MYEFILLLGVIKFNKNYGERKLQNGWIPLRKTDKEKLLSYGILSPKSMEETGENVDSTTPYVPNKTRLYIIYILNTLAFFLVWCLALVLSMALLRSTDTGY